MSTFSSSLHIELQQRGVEFSQLFGKYGNLRPALLERMPPMEMTRSSDAQTNGDSDLNDMKLDDSPQHHINNESVSNISKLYRNVISIFFCVIFQNALLDLLGGDGSDMDIIKPNSTTTSSQPVSNSNNQDLLDLLGGLDTLSSPMPPADTGIGLILENNNPVTNNVNSNSNFLTGDFLNTNSVNGTYYHFKS